MSKVYEKIAESLEGVMHDGMILAVGGFGLCGIPSDLIDVVKASGVKDLTVVSNNMGVDGKGLDFCLKMAKFERSLHLMLARINFLPNNFWMESSKSNSVLKEL